MANILELVAAVKAHARAHYNEGGWDYIVECYSDAEIAELIAGAKTAKGAIRKAGALVGLWAERRADVEGEIF